MKIGVFLTGWILVKFGGLDRPVRPGVKKHPSHGFVRGAFWYFGVIGESFRMPVLRKMLIYLEFGLFSYDCGWESRHHDVFVLSFVCRWFNFYVLIYFWYCVFFYHIVARSVCVFAQAVIRFVCWSGVGPSLVVCGQCTKFPQGETTGKDSVNVLVSVCCRWLILCFRLLSSFVDGGIWSFKCSCWFWCISFVHWRGRVHQMVAGSSTRTNAFLHWLVLDDLFFSFVFFVLCVFVMYVQNKQYAQYDNINYKRNEHNKQQARPNNIHVREVSTSQRVLEFFLSFENKLQWTRDSRGPLVRQESLV